MSSKQIEQLIRELLANDTDGVCEVALGLDTDGFMATMVEAGSPLNTSYGATIEEALTELLEFNKAHE
ncbi:hypothetical protein ACRS5A_18650 [Acinetobacter baumannii]|uniref:hypothetical protein n=1 Tax=Acinetobacter baumannii TaxID=470 RepID=UPI003B33E0A1